MTHWYHRKLTSLRYDASVFNDVVEFGKNNAWADGVDKNGMLWNVNELSLEYDQFPILQEIYDAVELEFKKPRFYISSVPAGGLPNHIDHQKWGNIGFPLIGDFLSTPQYYYDDFNHPVESFCLDVPVVFNTRMLHGIPRARDDVNPRWVLMLEVYDWIDNVFKKIDNGTFWKNSENFFYE